MHLSLALLVAALSTATSVSAAEAASCTQSNALGSAVSTLSSEGAGAAFCTSFLPITSKTVTTTVSPKPKTKTVTTYTKTITKHAPVTSTITTTTTISTCILPTSASQSGSFLPPGSSSFAKIKRASTSPSTVPTPAPLSSLSPKQISQACDCLAFPTPSSTVTVTRGKPTTTTVTVSKVKKHRARTTSIVTTTATTTTNTCAAPTTCNNQGLQYAVFQNVEGPNSNDPGYSVYDPTYMKSVRVGGDGPSDIYYNATTTTIGGIDYQCNAGQNISVYGSSQSFPCTFFSLDHRGYLYAPLTGTYEVAIQQVDDIAFIWTGSNAQAGWTRDNADLVAVYNTRGPGTGKRRYYLNKGEYLPIRIVFGQAQGVAAFSISVTDPKGRVLLNSNSKGSPYVVQHSCDGAAPPFPYRFGYER